MNLKKNKSLILAFIFLFIAIVFLRLHTFFIEYYGRDELASMVYARLNNLGGHLQQKGIIFTWFFSFCAFLTHNSPIGMHIMGIFVLFATSIILYFIALKLYSNPKIAFITAFIYSVSLSYGNQHMLEINGEILINFFYAIGIYFFLLWQTYQKKWAFFFFFLSGFLAGQVKFQGYFLFLLPVFYYGFLMPILSNNKKKRKIYIFSLLFAIIIFILIISADYICHFLPNFILRAKIDYILAKYQRDLGWWLIPLKPLHRYGMLILYCTPLWLGAFVEIVNLIKKTPKTKQDLFLITLFFSFIFTPFSTGISLFFHYFILLYIPLALLSAKKIFHWWQTSQGKTFLLANTLPFIFLSWSWFMKDIYIQNYHPEAFYKHYKLWNIIQSVALGANNDYLLPDPYIKKTLDLTKEIPKKDPVFIFGEAPEFAYYSKLNTTCNPWLDIPLFISFHNPRETHYVDSNLLRCIKTGNPSVYKASPLWFIDISEDPVNGLNKLGNNIIKHYPRTYKYLKKNFDLFKHERKIRIWKRKKVSPKS